MNNARRKAIAAILSQLEVMDIESIRDEEQEAFDNLSEGLQQSERGQASEQAADALDSAASSLQELIDYLTTASE